MGMTATEKILARTSGRAVVKAGDIVYPQPDFVMIHDGVVRGAAELHPPEQTPDAIPEIAFSVERHVRRKGLGSILFKRLITEARQKGYASLRITTGAQNDAMRALANKFGAHLTFRHGESTGSINLRKRPVIATLLVSRRGRGGEGIEPRLFVAVAHGGEVGQDIDAHASSPAPRLDQLRYRPGGRRL